MTYRHFLQANNIKDSLDAWRAYNEQYGTVYKMLKGAAREQYLEKSYILRFC